MAVVVAAIETSSFPLFSTFPLELRNQIWREALPDQVGPALYFYRKGCWCPRRLTESDEDYDADNDELNINFEFRHELLDSAQFDVPLVFVNHEARAVALAWARELGIEIRSLEDKEYPILVSPFNPMRDALYVAQDKLGDFLSEPHDRQSEPDLLDQFVQITPDLSRLAIPEALLRDQSSWLPELFLNFFSLEALYIVVDALTDLHSADNMKVHNRWEFEKTQGGAFFWNLDRGGFDFVDGEGTGDEALYKLMEEAGKELCEGLAQYEKSEFEIRPVLAFRS